MATFSSMRDLKYVHTHDTRMTTSDAQVTARYR
jgi:hypothetical protein